MYHIYEKFVRVFCNVKKMFSIVSISFSSLKFFQRSFLNFLRMNIKHTHASVRAANNHCIYNQHFLSKSNVFTVYGTVVYFSVFPSQLYNIMVWYSFRLLFISVLNYFIKTIDYILVPNIPVLIIYITLRSLTEWC